MSQKAKARLSLFGLLALFGGLGMVIFFGPTSILKGMSAGQTAPATIDPDEVTIEAPDSGRDVDIFVDKYALTNVDTDTDLRAYNATTGEWGSSVDCDPSNGTWISVEGGGGNLIELEVDNGYAIVQEEVGFVPDPTDTARPDFMVSRLSPSFSAGTFTLTSLSNGSIDDDSFPIDLFMYEASTPGTVSSQTLTSTTTAVNISVSASGTDRIVLEAYDDYGNRSELHFRADGGIAAAAGLSSFVESDDQVDSERTGLAPVAGAGVLLVGREFVTSFSIPSVPGAVLPVTIPMTYRSGLTDSGDEFDGAVGIGWDFGLDSRIEVDGTSRVWYPGNGRRESGFTSAGSHVWDSPAGIFRKLTYDKNTGEYSLESRDGTTLIYSGSSNVLAAQEDAYGNCIEYVRNVDNQVVEILDDRGHKTLLGWFDTGRLAVVEDYTGRRTWLNYDTNERLKSSDFADGRSRSWAYDSTYTYLLTEVQDGAGRAAIENIYGTSGGDVRRIVGQRDRACMTGSDYWEFDEVTGGCEVTDPLGSIVTYGFSSSTTGTPLESIEWQSNLNLRTVNASVWPPNSEDDPYAWRLMLETSTQNLLRTARYYEVEETSGTTTSNIETEEWVYESPTDTDPRLRSRLQSHTHLGDFSTSTDDIDETWDYSPASSSWPTSYQGFGGTTVVQPLTLSYDAGGQLLLRRRDEVNRATSGTIDIEERFLYDSRGRSEKYWGPSREGEYPDSPSKTNTYHTSGIQEGWLATSSVNDMSSAVLTTSYTHDSLGRRITKTTPDGSVWTWEYDEMGRVTRELQPEYVLTDPLASGSAQGETVWAYETDSGDLETIKRKNIDSTGANGSVLWPEENYEYTSAGLLDAIERDINSTEVTREELRYNARGDVVRRGTLVEDATTDRWSVVLTTYDERGMGLTTQALTGHPASVDAASASDPGLKQFYQYDHAGRIIESAGHEWETPEVRVYDDFGRLGSETTPETNLGLESIASSEISGYYKTEYTYTALHKVAKKETFSNEDGGGWETTSMTEHDYDLAGRGIKTRRAKTLSSPFSWVEHQVDLLPTGQPEKDYPEGYDSSTYGDLKTVYTYDVLDRQSTVTTPGGDVSTYTYSTSHGRLSERVFRPFDETAGTSGELVALTEDFHTTHDYDELGRAWKTTKKGTNQSGDKWLATERAFDTLGRRARTATIKVDGATSTTLSVMRNDYDLLGRTTAEWKGHTNLDTTSSPASPYELTTWTYDLAGQTEERSREADDGTSTRDWTYQYDALGRMTQEVLPSRGPSAPSQNITIAYNNSAEEPLVTTTDANGVIRTMRTSVTGKPVEELVGSSGTAAPGAQSVNYYYGGSTGCGCSGQGSVTQVHTEIDTLERTVVDRTYDNLGRITEESISVDNCPATVVDMTYGDHGGREEFSHAEAYEGTTLILTGSVSINNYASNGRLASVDFKETPASSAMTLFEYSYRGGLREVQTYYGDDGTDQLLGTYEFDSMGRKSSETWTEPDGSGGRDMVMRRSFEWRVDGKLLKRMQPIDDPVGTTTNELWQHVDYEDGTNWLLGFSWDDGASALGSGSGYKAREFDRSEYGEVDNTEDKGLENQGSAANTWDMYRDDAGYADPTYRYPSATYSQDDQVMKYGPTSGTVDDELTDRITNFDLMGRRTSMSFELTGVTGCDPETSDWDFEYDAWGRTVLASLERVCAGTTTYTTDIESIYDGFGRLVRKCVDTTETDPNRFEDGAEYLYYESGSVAGSIERESCSACDVVRSGASVTGGFPSPVKKEPEKAPVGGGEESKYVMQIWDCPVGAVVSNEGLALDPGDTEPRGWTLLERRLDGVAATPSSGAEWPRDSALGPLGHYSQYPYMYAQQSTSGASTVGSDGDKENAGDEDKTCYAPEPWWPMLIPECTCPEELCFSESLQKKLREFYDRPVGTRAGSGKNEFGSAIFTDGGNGLFDAHVRSLPITEGGHAEMNSGMVSAAHQEEWEAAKADGLSLVGMWHSHPGNSQMSLRDVVSSVEGGAMIHMGGGTGGIIAITKGRGYCPLDPECVKKLHRLEREREESGKTGTFTARGAKSALKNAGCVGMCVYESKSQTGKASRGGKSAKDLSGKDIPKCLQLVD